MQGTGRAASFSICATRAFTTESLSRRFTTQFLLTAISLAFSFFAEAAIPRLPVDVSASKDSEDLKTEEASPQVRVRLNTIEGAFTITGVDLRFVGSVQPARSGAYQAIRVTPGKTSAGFTDWQIEDRDLGTKLANVKARSFDVAGKNIRLNLKPIPGRLTLQPSRVSSGRRKVTRFDVVTVLDLEAYVRGVLPAEMPKGWPLEALKAQAVAARTFALFRKSSQRAQGYDLESTVMDQMYLVPDETLELENVERAVRETKGMVLLAASERPLPLPAYFHADCGGRTENAQSVWGTSGAGTAIDGSCPLNPLAKWRTVVSLDELSLRLRTLQGKSALAKLQDISLIGRNNSGRVNRLSLKWSDGETSELSPHDFRMAVGHERIKSTNFVIEREHSSGLVFAGKGFGHGVGLCQWGARQMAKEGSNFRQILSHYYPQAMLATTAKLTDGGLPVALNP